MDTPARISGSFRDPHGFVFSRSGVIYRQVSQSYAADYSRLMSSGLYAELVRHGLLIPHEELDLRLAFAEDAYKVLRPTQLPFVSHPYEWCFSQFKDAALATLRIQQLALEHGMSLKDASAYNIQLHNARPALIDTLSFEAHTPDRPWVAYRQFCQHFLAPLALMSRVDVRLGQLMRIHIDGVPLDLASRLLPWRTWLTFGLGLHLHAHAKFQGRYAARQTPTSSKSRGMSLKSLQAIIVHLERTIRGLLPRRERTEWADYYQANNNYGDAGLSSKEQCLRELLGALTSKSSKTVWDLGANDGRFGRLALEVGAQAVITWDTDPNCVEASYNTVIERRERNHHPLLLDLTNPSPAIGWANQERTSFTERGPADVVLALGLVHHLAISNNLPLSRIAAFLRSLGKEVLVEWIPKEDSQVQKLLANRCDTFPHYTQSAFETAFEGSFYLLRRVSVEPTCRTLYHFQRKPESCLNSMNGTHG